MSLPEDRDESSDQAELRTTDGTRQDTKLVDEATTRIAVDEQSVDKAKQMLAAVDPKALISDLLIEELSESGPVQDALIRTDSNTAPVDRAKLTFLNQPDALETIDDLDLEEKFRAQLDSLLQKGEETARLDLDKIHSEDEVVPVSPSAATGEIDGTLGSAKETESDAYRTQTHRAQHQSDGLLVFNQELVESTQGTDASEVIFETGEYVRPQLDEDEFAEHVPSIGGVFGPYRLLGCLAVGGMAEIFMAIRRDDAEMTPLALKRIRKHRTTDDDSIKMFQEEGKICLTLSHPNIVNYRDFDVLDGVPYLVMNFIEGMNLQTLAHHCNLSSRAIIEVGLSVSQALSYAHSLTNEKNEPLKLVHRDISPQNILIDRRGTVKLVDFGIARFEGRSFHTGVGPRRGKLAYMAPEQLNYEHPVDLRADLFSLGMVLSEMFLGKSLMPNGPLVAGDLSRVIRSELESLSEELPQELIDTMARMVSFKVEQRPWSAQEVHDVFTSVLTAFDDQQQSLADYGKTIVANKVLPADVTIRNLIQGIRDSKKPEEDTKMNDSLDLEEAEVRALLQNAADTDEPSQEMLQQLALSEEETVKPPTEPVPASMPETSKSPVGPADEPAPEPDSVVANHAQSAEINANAQGLAPEALPSAAPKPSTERANADKSATSPRYGVMIASFIAVALLLVYLFVFQA